MHVPGNGGGALLHKIVRSSIFDVAVLVKLLVKCGADIINAQNLCNWAPYHEVSYCGKLDVVQLLLAHGASVYLRDDNGDAPLHKALQSGILDIVELRVKCGATVNSPEESGLSPPHQA